MPLRNVPDNEDDVGGGWAKEKVDYSHDLIMNEALQWVEEAGREPFFLYLALTIPHANNEAGRGLGDGQEVPEYGIYADKDWPNPDKGQAAMITRMDRDLGRLFEKLKTMGIDKDTCVLFTSDNGHHKEGGNRPEFFDANGPLRGMKRDLYEGGIRVPTIVRWPGTIAPGSVSDHPAYFGDYFATACDSAALEGPGRLDSVSFLPTLKGRPQDQKKSEYLYWEFYERGGKQAVRFGQWKAVRFGIGEGKMELYDLSRDLGEANDLSVERPELASLARTYMDRAHVADPQWKVRGKLKGDQPAPGDGKQRW
ncbi:MAG: sulfatase-like hydrolase/transferase [Verrucomicrobiota bacterium]